MENKGSQFFLHETSIIDEDVEIGKDTKVWHWCHISKNVKIGKNCIFGQNTFIGSNVIIGDNCKIQNNVSIYDGVEIANNVFIGPSVVFTNIINPRSIIERKKEFKKTIIEEGVSIGANSTIVCGNKLNKYCFIGAGSVVTKDVKSFSLVYGNPAVHKGWFSRSGVKLDLPLEGDNLRVKCNSSNKYYILKNKILQEEH